ncbi:MAG: dihydrofolate reductase family protein [Patescibacteria group bacterium]|jgi:dihydrofolate reductase|nr:dihydrofolate reductase family protein [Patescibacteria group bacterium]
MKVIMMMAITADGKIAKDKNQFANWTSPEDKKKFIEVSKDCGVIMMGENTFNTFPAPLKNRLNVVFTKNPDNKESIEGVKWVSGEVSKVLEELNKLGYKKALLGGGSYLNSLFLKENLIDEIMLSIEPKIFGSGLNLFNLDKDTDLELIECSKLNDNTVFVHYKVKK